MSVLRKLRRGSKDAVQSIPVSEGRPDLATQPTQPTPSTPGRLTFFDLPAEVRNAIYELLAAETVLTLPPPEERKKRIAGIIPQCGLVLASRQCRQEFLPLFYSTSPVVIDIRDFDFSNIIRVIGSLYSTELKALRANHNLIIRLRTLNCTRANLDELRRWLVNRADSLDRLPFRYEVFLTDPAGRIGCFRQSREITFYRERLERMSKGLDELLQWELHAIIDAFERKSRELDALLQGLPVSLDPTRRPIRGLMGGGLR